MAHGVLAQWYPFEVVTSAPGGVVSITQVSFVPRVTVEQPASATTAQSPIICRIMCPLLIDRNTYPDLRPFWV